MALEITSGPVHLVDVDLQTAPIILNGPSAVAYLRGVECGDIIITQGQAFLDDVDCGVITLTNNASNQAKGSNIRCDGLDLNGGAPGQEVILNAIHVNGGQLLSVSTFDIWSITGLTIGDSVAGGVSAVDLTDLEDFTLQATILGSDQHGVRLEDCVVGQLDLHILDPSMATDNTYDGISLQGVCDRLNIRGAVRGAVRQADNPRYGVDVASGCLDIDLWLAITGAQTGDVNDATSGQVTIH